MVASLEDGEVDEGIICGQCKKKISDKQIEQGDQIMLVDTECMHTLHKQCLIELSER
mgnify:FL=1